MPAWELAAQAGMDLPPGKHWMDWYLAALNGEQEHQDWLAKRKARQTSRQTA